jgi:hypothetical protein
MLVRLKSAEGQKRFTIDVNKETIGSLKKILAEELHLNVNDFTMSSEIDPNNARQIMGLDTQPLKNMPIFEEGMILRVDLKAGVKEN